MEMANQKQQDICKTKSPKCLTEKQSALIFWTIKAAYGNKFMSAFKTAEEMKSAQAVWAKYCGFLNDDEIQRGLDRCIKVEDWNPNIAEFLRMALDLPNENLAVARVISGDCSDPVSARIRKIIGTWDIGHQPQQAIISRARGLYREAYSKALDERL